jgi:transposase
VVRRQVEPVPEVEGGIGIDWGVTTTATTTDPAYDLPHVGARKTAATELKAAQRTMARQAADAAVGTIKRTLIEYGERAGRKVVLVQPAYTTMTCSRCFARAKRLMLHERTFACPACGLIADRDVNAARVMLAVAERGHTSVESVRPLIPPLEVSGAA